ncbi:hypothetical protein C7380_10289 [Oceanotoga teriensis]|uniref:DUF2225 domain-containing protein n=1 Tax=Oceanotoga teriensis TaxID=515440 RepID=A0AA45HJN3_9BACT|nr:DUF2225 domain-containing protein [Oceanotoga teriensis]PWJ96178.1 hypothetical protein C7380_10289 [Oceanotoga teriensis]
MDYWKDTTECPVCKNTFMYSKVSTAAISVKSYDKDLKPNYNGPNPLKHSIITCPNCFFTFNEKDVKDIHKFINDRNYSKIKDFLSKLYKDDFFEVNNYEDKSNNFYKQQIVLASEIYSILDLPFEVGRLLLKLSWQYRDDGDEGRELKILNDVLKITLNYFEKALDNRDTIFSLFYTGYIYYRLGDKKNAAKYLDKLFRMFKDSKSPYIRAAKDLRGELE